MDIVALFCDLDNFAVGFEPMFRQQLLSDGKPHRNQRCGLHLSEVMTIKLLLRKRAIIETAIDQLKNIGQIEHSRHRGVLHYFADVIAGLIAYTYRDKLPSLNLRPEQLKLLEGAAI